MNLTSEPLRAIAVKVYGSFETTPGRPSSAPGPAWRQIIALPDGRYPHEGSLATLEDVKASRGLSLSEEGAFFTRFVSA